MARSQVLRKYGNEFEASENYDSKINLTKKYLCDNNFLFEKVIIRTIKPSEKVPRTTFKTGKFSLTMQLKSQKIISNLFI